MKTSRLIQAWRFARLTLHLLTGLLEATVFFPRRNAMGRARAIVRWSSRLCRILGVEVRVHGSPPGLMPHNTILVANHISWLDIFVMNSSTPSRFVAKAEVRDWPVAGWIAHRTGTLFVTRERRHDTVRVNRLISAALTGGDCIAVFPEGSTTEGDDVANFNASLLQPAIEAAAQVIPVALCYYDRDGHRSKAAAYVGEMSLLESLLLLVAEPGLTAELSYCPSLAAGEWNRRELATQAHLHIREVVRRRELIANHPSLLDERAPEISGHPPA
ncbi:1-acyl-sn-glycerol-3-phosphate acyltransferase [Chitinimonas arctica]|uniref:1-acyl-sn-glycerol-3-phosphate acyltransferase n=1 Tax=Chitinimonas arctica TaxID=2594795 RepID=A0A516SDX5_9NEIS|nr:lysophospholipid acyltransferase family protein [Chitinimonas arctica]QDQ26356.1 1-acyl-sn-glycerol-3-phosphate acyltransferase [Chitinimonas arctica]